MRCVELHALAAQPIEKEQQRGKKHEQCQHEPHLAGPLRFRIRGTFAVHYSYNSGGRIGGDEEFGALDRLQVLILVAGALPLTLPFPCCQGSKGL